MTSPADDWSPEPQLLAAYFDGELDGRPAYAALRRRIAQWLHEHPDAGAVLDDYRRLRHLWRDTAPPDPGPEAWRSVADELARLPLPSGRRDRWRRWGAALLAAAAAVALAVGLGVGRGPAPDRSPPPARRTATPPPDEILPVATAAEVTILRVEGDDTPTLVVGELPLQGPLELAGPGEVVLTSVQPDGRDRMLPHVRMDQGHRPMIWARVDPDDRDP